MLNKDGFMKEAFDVLHQNDVPSQHQKDMMLDNILTECRNENISYIGRLKRLVTAYPWRFAFGVSAVQSISFTLIWGPKYTNLFVGFLGGRI